jgi:hypothetical protein
MKFLFLASLLVLCSCAAGSTADVPDEPTGTISATPKPPQKPAPTPEPTAPQTDPQCTVNAYWVDDCYVVDIICKDKPERLDVSCGPGRPLWPWEIIPDPPYENNNRK